MGLFGPYIYKNKYEKKFWLHMKKKGKSTLYYFSKDPRGAINSLPKGYTVTENPMTGFPFVKKKAGGLASGLFKKSTVKEVIGEKTE
jgi:hypothetical protein